MSTALKCVTAIKSCYFFVDTFIENGEARDCHRGPATVPGGARRVRDYLLDTVTKEEAGRRG